MDIIEKKLEEMVSSLSVDTPGVLRDNLDEIFESVRQQRREQKRLDILNSKLQVSCKEAKEKMNSLDKERADARRELNKLKEDDAAVSKKIIKLKTEIRDSQSKLLQAKNKNKITENELEILRRNETEMLAFKDLTGIRWVFNVPDNKLQGLITNSKKSSVKTFDLDKSLPSKKIRETLWSYIKESSTERWEWIEENEENEENRN